MAAMNKEVFERNHTSMMTNLRNYLSKLVLFPGIIESRLSTIEKQFFLIEKHLARPSLIQPITATMLVIGHYAENSAGKDGAVIGMPCVFGVTKELDGPHSKEIFFSPAIFINVTTVCVLTDLSKVEVSTITLGNFLIGEGPIAMCYKPLPIGQHLRAIIKRI